MDERPGIHRRIVCFHRDDDGHWVAELDCGHGRHVRHNPPFQIREWTRTAGGRAAMLGVALECRTWLDDLPGGTA